MHMADALVSPLVGGVMLAASAGLTTLSIRKVQLRADNQQIPLMGVMGAFVFAAQMVNFAIPGTGSSGHLGGGILLAMLLGPHAGFITMAAILLIQALFFGDGGLLAYGCNVFNLAFFTCLVVWPLVCRPMLRRGPSVRRIWTAAMLASVLGLQLGSLSVALQTLLSGRTELPFAAFVYWMQPIHLAIGLVEGAVTAAVVTFLWRARPELIATGEPHPAPAGKARTLRPVLVAILVAALAIGGGLSILASALPDGLEWSVARVAGELDEQPRSVLHTLAAQVQAWTAILPDYQPRPDSGAASAAAASATGALQPGGTAFAGVAGALLTLLLTAAAATLAVHLKRRRRRAAAGAGAAETTASAALSALPRSAAAAGERE